MLTLYYSVWTRLVYSDTRFHFHEVTAKFHCIWSLIALCDKSEQDKMTLNLGAIYGWGGCNVFRFFGSAPATLQKFIVVYKVFSLLQDLVTYFKPITAANITDYRLSRTAENSGSVRPVNIWGQCKLVPTTVHLICNNKHKQMSLYNSHPNIRSNKNS